LNPNEFDDAYEDRQKLRGAILTEEIASLGPQAPITVRPGATVHDAVAVMNEKKCGCVCVTENDRLVGIFTERDVLTKVVGRGLDPKKVVVGELMTRNPETLTARDKIAFALNKMHVGGYRHVPLVEKGKLTGVISIRDIAEFVVALFPDGVLNVPPEPSLGIPQRPEGG
jgi:CBS domain-containing protein